MKKSENMTYAYYVSVEEGKVSAAAEMEAGERDEIRDRLCRQYIERGLRGEVVVGNSYIAPP